MTIFYDSLGSSIKDYSYYFSRTKWEQSYLCSWKIVMIFDKYLERQHRHQMLVHGNNICLFITTFGDRIYFKSVKIVHCAREMSIKCSVLITLHFFQFSLLRLSHNENIFAFIKKYLNNRDVVMNTLK